MTVKILVELDEKDIIFLRTLLNTAEIIEILAQIDYEEDPEMNGEGKLWQLFNNMRRKLGLDAFTEMEGTEDEEA